MKKLALALFLLLSGPAHATGKIAVTAISGGDVCVAGVGSDICNHITAGKDLVVRVDQPDGGACADLRGEAFQISTKLEMPLGGDGLRAAAKNDCHHQEFYFTAPAVRAETEFSIRLQSREGGGEWKPLQDVGVMVYPVTLLDSVKSWAANDKNALVVKRDKEGDFTAFLDSRKIVYYTATATPRDVTVAEIVVGEPEENEKPAINTLYLEEKARGKPSLRVREKDGVVKARAQFKLIEGLKAGEPLAEKEFAELFAIIAK
jgi:hypothetical protein